MTTFRVVSYGGRSEPVLTVRQPWAELIVSGIKDVENRSWSTSYRGRLWIHASVSRVDREPEYVRVIERAPRGAIVGHVDLVDVVTDAPSKWAAPGKCHWLLANPLRLEEPVSAVGRLGLWSVPPELG
jgi:ASCH domain